MALPDPIVRGLLEDDGAPRGAGSFFADGKEAWRLPITVEATVRVLGHAGERDAFRRRANDMLAAEFPEASYRELHTADALDWRLECAGGMPFPPFVEASVEHPALDCALEWRDRERSEGPRRASLKAGRLTLEEAEGASASGATSTALALQVARDGQLLHALVMCSAGEPLWMGYVASAARHAFFCADSGAQSMRVTEGLEPEWSWRLTLEGDAVERERLDPTQPMSDAMVEALDALADAFAAEWLWFAAAPETDTAIERHRYAQYGFAVRPANVRSLKLKRELTECAAAYVLEPSDPAVREVCALVARLWSQSDRA